MTRLEFEIEFEFEAELFCFLELWCSSIPVFVLSCRTER